MPEHATIPREPDAVLGRFGDVEGLRALGLLLVVAYETVRFIGLPPSAPPAVARIFWDASQGLPLFLLISGFVLAYPVVADLQSDGVARLYLGDYAFKRLLRLYPTYIVALVATALLAPLSALFGLNVPGIWQGPLPPFDWQAFARDAAFSGDGAGNDGFRAVALTLRGYIVFPFALALWNRLPAAALGLGLAAVGVDAFTDAHGWGLAGIFPLVLGIAAADLRARRARFQSLGLVLAVAAIATAWTLEPLIATLPGYTGVPDGLRIDPFWSLAFFGILMATGSLGWLGRLAGFAPFRMLGALSYAVALVAMPMAAFASRQLAGSLGLKTIVLVTVAAQLVLGFVLWQVVDRWSEDDGLRRRLAAIPGPVLDRILAPVRLDRLIFRRVRRTPEGALSAPPLPERLRSPRPAADPGRLAARNGSAADDLAAEILETKRRLLEQSMFVAPLGTPAAAAEPQSRNHNHIHAEYSVPEEAALREAAPPAESLAAEPAGVPEAGSGPLHAEQATRTASPAAAAPEPPPSRTQGEIPRPVPRVEGDGARPAIRIRIGPARVVSPEPRNG